MLPVTYVRCQQPQESTPASGAHKNFPALVPVRRGVRSAVARDVAMDTARDARSAHVTKDRLRELFAQSYWLD